MPAQERLSESKKSGFVTTIVVLCGLSATLFGIASATAWIAGAPDGAQVFTNSKPVAFNAALAFILCGIALIAWPLEWRSWSIVAGSFVAAFGALSLALHILGFDFALLSSAETGTVTPIAAALFVILGAVLAGGATIRRSKRSIFATIALPGILISALTGLLHLVNLTGLGALSGWANVLATGLNSSIGVAIVSVGIAVYGLAACRRAGESFPRWPAWLAGAAVAATTILLWQALHESEYLDNQRRLQIEVIELKETFIDRIVTRIAPVGRLKARWEREGELSSEAWNAFTSEVMAAEPAFSAFVYLDRDYRLRRLRPRDPSENVAAESIAQIDTRALDESRKTAGIVLTSPISLTSAGPEILMLYPIYREGRFEGFVGVAFAYETLFRDLVDEHAKKGTAVSVMQGTEEIASSLRGKVRGDDEVDLSFPLMMQNFNIAAWVLPKGGRPGLSEAVLLMGMLIAASLIVALSLASRANARLARSEEQHRDLFENAPVAMLSISPKGKFLRTNQAYCALLGYSEDELTEIDPMDVVHPGDRLDLRRQSAATVIGEQNRLNSEARLVRKDGQTIWVLISAKMMDGIAGPHLLVHVQDISARKLAEEKLFQSQKMEALGNLAGGIAHDFNNMLQPIIALSEMSQDQLEVDHPIRENLQIILAAGLQASHLVQQILTFSRQNETSVGAIDMTQCVGEAVRLVRNVIPSSITVCEEIAPDAGFVFGDRAQLVSVIMNLGSNAKHAIKDKVGLITFRLERAVIDAGIAARVPGLSVGSVYARLEVSDSGCGMDSATVAKIFNPFFTTKEVGKGTGLGLSMVHGIVEKMQGAIDVISELDVGTTFNIYLPLQEQQEEDPATDLLAAA